MNACSKMTFNSRGAAKADARRIKNKGHGGSRVYLCPNCGGWHLTTRPKHGRRKGGR